MAYNNAIPQATNLISNSQSQILANFSAIDSSIFGFTRNHVTLTDSTNGGLHTRIDYHAAVASPSISGFISSLYPRTSTNVELYYKNASQDIQVTNSALTASSGQGFLPGGLQIRCGSSQFTGASVDKAITYTAFPNGLLSANAIIFNNTSITLEILVSGAATTGFTVRKLSSSGSQFFYWMAIGY